MITKPLQGKNVHPDLHIHSTFSDGIYSPEALCPLIEAAGLTHVALCDHNTLEGIAPFSAALTLREKARGVASPLLIPGVEISAGDLGRTHILGYGANPDSSALQLWMQDLLSRRLERFHQMLKKLAEHHMEIPLSLLPPLDGQHPVGRPHLARALVSLGYVSSLNQAFSQWLGNGKPAEVPYRHISAAEAVAGLQNVGCIPVLAHPARLSLSMEGLFALIQSLQSQGLMGVEVFHPSISPGDLSSLESFVRSRGLLVTGGSDFHGDIPVKNPIGCYPGNWQQKKADLEALLQHLA